MTGTTPAALRPLEVASGLVYGRQPGCAPLDPAPVTAPSPRVAFEQAVLGALTRPPCVVSFSGGRDSSAVLAVAVTVARREGLPPPVAVTLRFPDVDTADEVAWQEQVVGHLGVDDWERVVLRDELDSVGPYARRLLADHGLLWPFNAHFHLPVAERARGGTLLTGIGGDELLSPSPWRRVQEVLARRARPVPRDVVRVALACGPAPLRVRGLRRRALPPGLGWLRPAARDALATARVRAAAAAPVRWDRQVTRWWWPSRARVVGAASLDRVVAAGGARAAHPLQDPGFLAALARAQGAAGFHDRSTAMRQLFGDVLPGPVLTRTSKASFDAAFWTAHSRAHLAAWDGRTGIDPAVVDPDALRREWARPVPDPRSFLLLQAVWLAGQASRTSDRRLEEELGRRVQEVPAARPAQLDEGQGRVVEEP